MKSSTNRNFRVPLPDNTYSRLKSQAQRQRKPATQLVKQAVNACRQKFPAILALPVTPPPHSLRHAATKNRRKIVATDIT
ncbi:MAG: hypothetical protein MZW92_49295 [Comamonadaceae bacterium]|nr:hypothetical protein [Comamonadaceae bacterium]